MSTQIHPGEAIDPQLGGEIELPTPVPLMVCRHYVRNYFDLFMDLFQRLYTVADQPSTISVRPGQTVGGALNVIERSAAYALADDADGESPLIGLVRTMAEDAGQTPEMADTIAALLSDVLKSDLTPTFEDKGDQLETVLATYVASGTVPQDQADRIVGAFRSIGGVIANLLAFEFPALDGYRADLSSDPERYVLIDGGYTARVSGDPEDVFSVSFGSERIELRIDVESFEIDEDANFRFYKVKNNGKTKEKHEMLMRAMGSLSFDGIRLTLDLSDELGSATDYTWAPGHDVRRADFTKTSAELRVDAVSLDLLVNAATILVAFFEWHWTVSGLEDEWSDLIRDSINDQGDIAELGEIADDYITPIALRLIPISHGLSRVRYGDPFEADGVWSYQSFSRMETTYETRSVVIRNEEPDASDDGVVHELPDDLPGPDIDPGPADWIWPSIDGTSGRPQLDLDDPDDRAVAVGLLAGTAGLPVRTKAIAALSLERVPTSAIGALETTHVDFEAGTVLGRTVTTPTLDLLQAVLDEGEGRREESHLFRYGGFSGKTYLVRSEIRGARRRVAGPILPPIDPVEVPLISDFDPGIWKREYSSVSPMRTSRGQAADPGWIGLSTNCVVATDLYRGMRRQGLLVGEGSITDGDEVEVAYQVFGCLQVAADFSGDAPDDAPAVAFAGLEIGLRVGENPMISYMADVRLRLKPVIHPRGCLPDSAVTEVSQAVGCLEKMTGGAFDVPTRLREIFFRDFVTLAADVTVPSTDVQLLGLTRKGSEDPPPNPDLVEARIQLALADWFPTLPEPPILYNCFRPVGGETRNFFAQNGWLSVYGRYPFPSFDDLHLG